MFMENKEKNSFKEIIKSLDEQKIRQVLTSLRSFMADTGCLADENELDEVERDYRLMLEYMGKGFDDPQRGDIYERLVRKMYGLCGKVILSYNIKNFSLFADAKRQASRFNFSLDFIKFTLENFIADVAMLEFEAEDVRSIKSKELYIAHDDFMQSLFCHILVSEPWSDEYASAMEKLLLSPTIDINDAQLLISAMTLAVMNNGDLNKFKVLADIYKQTAFEKIRQRALVGWAVSLSEVINRHEAENIVADMVTTTNTVNDLVDLQKQMIYCMNAEQDHDKIQKDIMPELLKNNNLKITRFGIVEKEEDAMSDIFDPGASERAMEKMEDSFRKMIDMQKAGSDIYFGGFSQMKRYPFFYKVANWFTPFYMEHSGISDSLKGFENAKMLEAMVKHGPFCDSDKYSFVLVLASVISNLPANMRELFGSADNFGQMVSDEEQTTPAYIRRMILQDMYRFFRLYSLRSQLVNPFDEKHFLPILNVASMKGFVDSVLPELAYFMYKHKNISALEQLLNVCKDCSEPKFLLIKALYNIDFKNELDVAGEILDTVLATDSENKRALSLAGKVCFTQGNYSRAAEFYGRLYDLDTDNATVALNYCVALSKACMYDRAVNLLYKLTIESPDSVQITRVLAWTLMGLSKFEQAEKEYNRLLKKENIEAGDYLNAGYCYWCMGDVPQAVSMFLNFVNMIEGDKDFSGIYDEMLEDKEFLMSHGKSETDIILMTDFITYLSGERGC